MSSETKKYIFFLGGLDLEMLEIKNILEEKNLTIINRELSWGAKLSDYKDELSKEDDSTKKQTYVFIELEMDDKHLLEGKEYKIIDHHNEQSHKKSSLEQLIEFLNTELGIEVAFTRYRQLIAINDVKHIKGMQEADASESEIAEIRAADRKAQGITESEEALAKESVKSFKRDDGLITTIKAQTDRFSAITDFIYQEKSKHLIIYNEQSLNYYGPAKNELVSFLKNKSVGQFLYHGGDENGFLGIEKYKLSPDQLSALVDEITGWIYEDEKITQLPVTEKQEVYSYHLFSFPFIFKGKDGKAGEFSWPLDQEQQEEMTAICADKLVKADKWNNEGLEFSPKYILDYNEQNYFYPFIYNSIYGNRTESKSMQYLQVDLDKYDSKEYIITYSKYDKNFKGFKEHTYTLQIDNVALQLYSTGVGVLMFYLGNYKKDQSAPDDILRINQFGRRLYPPFLGATKRFTEAEDYENFGEGLAGSKADENNNLKNTVRGVKQLELPSSLKVLGTECTFEKYQKSLTRPEDLRQLPDFMLDLFKSKDGQKIIKIKPVLDDRMFVLCWYGNPSISMALSGRDDRFLKNDWWYHYVHVDNPGFKTCQNNEMAADLIKKATNPRWSKFGTLFGITDYSFVVLSTDHQSLKNYGSEFLVNHLRTMYHKMVGLCLFQRASLLGFSEQLQNNSSGKNAHKNIRSIYKNYSLFINQHYFREITPQTQGIELYRRLHECFEIEREVNHIDREMHNFHDIVVLEESEINNNNTERLNRVVAAITSFLILPGFIVGFYGMNSFDNALSLYNKWHYGIIILLLFISGLGAYYYFDRLLLSRNSQKAIEKPANWKIVLSSIAFFFVLSSIPMWNDSQSTDSFFRGTIQPVQKNTDPSTDIQIVIPARTVKGKKELFQIPADTLKFNLKTTTLPDSIVIHQTPE